MGVVFIKDAAPHPEPVAFIHRVVEKFGEDLVWEEGRHEAETEEGDLVLSVWECLGEICNPLEGGCSNQAQMRTWNMGKESWSPFHSFRKKLLEAKGWWPPEG